MARRRFRVKGDQVYRVTQTSSGCPLAKPCAAPAHLWWSHLCNLRRIALLASFSIFSNFFRFPFLIGRNLKARPDSDTFCVQISSCHLRPDASGIGEARSGGREGEELGLPPPDGGTGFARSVGSRMRRRSGRKKVSVRPAVHYASGKRRMEKDQLSSTARLTDGGKGGREG